MLQIVVQLIPGRPPRNIVYAGRVSCMHRVCIAGP